MKKLELIAEAVVYIGMMVVLSACASVDRASIEKSGLVGSWKSYNFEVMNIYCSGAFDKTSDFGTHFLIGNVHSESKGDWVKKITSSGFTTGPWELEYSVTEWPHSENGITRMTMDNRIWELVERYSCQ